jgi:hypothetical protein
MPLRGASGKRLRQGKLLDAKRAAREAPSVGACFVGLRPTQASFVTNIIINNLALGVVFAENSKVNKI